MTAVVLDGAGKTYKGRRGSVDAVSNLDLTIGDGEFVTLVGPSGCGKTTTLRMIAGLEDLSVGRLLFDGKDVTRTSIQKRELSMVFQNYAIFPHMDVARNIGYGLHVAKVPKTERDETVARVAKLVGIGGLLERYPRELSGGQRQRVALARALAREPSLVLFDEPLSNLDAKLRDEMRAELKQLHQRLGNTMIFVTHDQLEATTLSDRVAVLLDGQLQQYATPQEVFRNPVNTFVARFIGSPSMNLIDATLETVDGEYVARLKSGMPVAVDATTAAAAPSRSVKLGARPQDLMLNPAGSYETLGWKVNVIEPIGTEAIVHVEHNGVTLKAVCPEPTPFEPGDVVSMSLKPERILLFDAETGLAVRA